MPAPVTKDYLGYQVDFLGTEHPVPLPELIPSLRRNCACLRGSDDREIPYQNYSILQHRERRLPILTAANIDGNLFREMTRKEVSGGKSDRWYKDKRIAYHHQWGNELYRAPRSDFDKGHLTKREDVQWGIDHQTGLSGARSTFFYTNAAPQHPKLNRRVWLVLENYLLHTEAVARGARVCVFTGPVLSERDPIFVAEVRDQQVQLPTLFWKVIYYVKPDRELYKIAFLMGQAHHWRADETAVFPRGDEPFADFERAPTYQVNVATVEQLTGLTFAPALDAYQDDRPVGLILEEVGGRGSDASTESRIEGLRF